MDLTESFRTLRRRWILTSLLFLLTLAGTAGALVKLPWTYTSQSTVVLLASPHASKAVAGNPYLAFDASITLTADVVRRVLMDPRTVQDLAGRGYSASYTVVDAPDTTGPVLLVTASGSNKAAVENTLHGVTNEVSTKLNELQSSVAPDNQIGQQVIAMSPQALLNKSKKARPLAVILALGLALTFVIPQILDRRSATRRRGQEGVAGESAAKRFATRDPASTRFTAMRLTASLDRDGESDSSSAVSRRRYK